MGTVAGALLVLLVALPAATAVPMDALDAGILPEHKAISASNLTQAPGDEVPVAPLGGPPKDPTTRPAPEPGVLSRNANWSNDEAPHGGKSPTGDALGSLPRPSLPRDCTPEDLALGRCAQHPEDPGARRSDEPGPGRSGEDTPREPGTESAAARAPASEPRATDVKATGPARGNPLPAGTTETVTTSGLIAILWTLFVASPRPLHRTVRTEEHPRPDPAGGAAERPFAEASPTTHARITPRDR